MTWQEALKIKQNWTPEQARNDLERLIITGERPADKVVGLACQALEKQIPKKPIGEYTSYKCPICDRRVRSGKGSSSRGVDYFCQRCGQALDWSDAE